MRKVSIDPITRLEGHGKIDIFLDEHGEVANAYLQIPELRGFERFAVGRPVEDMPQITSRICGVCPMAHHMAAAGGMEYATVANSESNAASSALYRSAGFEPWQVIDGYIKPIG